MDLMLDANGGGNKYNNRLIRLKAKEEGEYRRLAKNFSQTGRLGKHVERRGLARAARPALSIRDILKI